MRISSKSLIAILAALLLCAAVAAAVLWSSRPQRMQVRVTVDGREYGTYYLNQEQTVTISPEDGSWQNVLVIRNGQAAIVQADCENQVCVHTPALREDRFGVIVCLPHSVVVELI